jgi:hypothetical protein
MRRFRLIATTKPTITSAQQQVGKNTPVQQLRDRRGGAKAVQHAGQREKQHEGVQPRDRIQRQHARRAAM